MARNPLQQLADFGQSVWCDNLSRALIHTGGLQRLIDDFGVVGVTSNPTIFDKAISGSDMYDDQIRELVACGRNLDEIYEELVVRDIQDAADLLRPIYDATRARIPDGLVSLEVSPTLAYDTQRTIEDVRRLWKHVDRPNVMIKIPGTPEGLPAIEEMLYEGRNINITLLFSLDAYARVTEAYLRALERRLEESKPLDSIASVASFFVSRVDTETDKRLQQIIDNEPGTERASKARSLLGKLAIANAKLAFQQYKQVFESERFARLAKHGARVQRPLWASTSTKNPNYPDTLYVDNLIGGPTVQTLPPETISAFADHGRVAPTLEQDLDAARQVFHDLEELGISYQDITDTLTRQGVDSFAKSFVALLEGLNAKIERFRAELTEERQRSLDGIAGQVRQALDELAADNVPARLQARDPSLWHGERNTIAQRLGWLPVVERMLDEARQGVFQQFADEVRERGYQRALLLGMGGSSLAPEVFSKVYPARSGYPKLVVLDSTNPDTIARVAEDVRDRKTLFIVSTKSGTTVETLSLYRYFLEQRGGDAGDFIAITDPGSPLDQEAQTRRFWNVFRNPPDIGGRYSALSYFGLVAAAAAGVDVERLLMRAALMLPVRDVHHPGIWLGAVMGAAQRAGRDKLTLVTSPGWAPFADWLEQLIAESTGKDGTGIIPVTHEPLAGPEHYRDDRLFVYISERDTALGDAALDARVEALRQAGQPVVELRLGSADALGGEFVRWEVATAVAGGLLGINPFDEANVQEAKDATNAVLRDASQTPPPALSAVEAAERVVGSVKPGGYLAILAYVDRTPAVESALGELRHALRERVGVATTLGYGPRYLHSTGQLHKGGPETGTFLMIVAQPSRDLPIPGADYSFARLFAAQAAGDAITLSRHGLPLARVDAGEDAVGAIQSLISAVTARAATVADD